MGCHHVVTLADVLPWGREVYMCTICHAYPLDGLGRPLIITSAEDPASAVRDRVWDLLDAAGGGVEP